MSDSLKIFTDAWGQLGRAPIAAVIAASAIALGLVLKKWQKFDNRRIPLFVIAWCSIWYGLLGDPSKITAVVIGWRQYVVLGFYGIILGFVAWGAHKFLLKKLEKFLPEGFFPEVETGNTDVLKKSSTTPEVKP